LVPEKFYGGHFDYNASDKGTYASKHHSIRLYEQVACWSYYLYCKHKSLYI